jgi:hypothetical protein
MLMRGQKGCALKCISCGHEGAIFFREPFDAIKELAFRARGFKKCPECGGKMRRDPDKFIVG